MPSACQGCCETVRGIEVSPRSRGFSRHCLDKRNVTACKVEIEQTQQMLQEAQKAHNKAITKLYEQLRNLLSSNTKSLWDCVCRKMHERDLWAAVNSRVTKGRHLRMWTSFLNCLELHKFTVFSADAAKRQWLYIQQAMHKPQRGTV